MRVQALFFFRSANLAFFAVQTMSDNWEHGEQARLEYRITGAPPWRTTAPATRAQAPWYEDAPWNMQRRSVYPGAPWNASPDPVQPPSRLQQQSPAAPLTNYQDSGEPQPKRQAPSGSITVVEPGDPLYATDGVPWSVCSRCKVFRPFAAATGESCANRIGVECTYDEPRGEAQQQEPYWPATSSSGPDRCDKCWNVVPCACQLVGPDDWCPVCGRYDTCQCDCHEVEVANAARRLHRREVEEKLKTEVRRDRERARELSEWGHRR